MQRLAMLITPDGEWVLPGSSEFLEALGDPHPDYDAEAYAVKNLGFIKLTTIERTIVEIELHPRNVALPALLAVQQQLLSAQLRLFRLKFFDHGWRSEISSSRDHTIERLSELCVPEFTPFLSERYVAEQRNLGEVFDNEDNFFRPLAQKWRVSFGNFDSTIVALALRTNLLPRLAVIGVNARQPEPVFRFIGQGHEWVGQNYHFLGVGQKVADQPDKEYGQWVAQF
ncbi:MAG TPA: hypothetical protein VMF86_09090, partial [Stellaceae bacterium]|nr:hypothetical protein [Stellaceae bacterium]